MQKKIEINKVELELLNLRLTEAETECYNIQKELRALKLSQTKTNSIGLWRRTTVAAVSVLAFASLLSTSVFHDAQSNVKNNNQPEASAISALENGQILRGKRHSTSDKKPPPRSGKENIRLARAIEATQRQWGPLLVMPEPEAKKRYYAFDPLVKEQQENLLILGFDIGEADGFKGLHTGQAIAEFRALYLPDSAKQLKDTELAVIIATYANLARSDAARFGIDHGIVAAIRLSSVRTGVNFSYLMKLAATESNFEPAVKSATSSATGIYQFTHNTWLNTLKRHGAKYGLVADYAANIEYYETLYGYQRPVVRDELMYEHLLALRKNPRLSAIMVAEMVRDNQQILTSSIDREPTETDLYLTHFLGTDKAITFLQSLEQSPDMHAVELFPREAKSNHNIFHPKTCAPRTVDEVYTHFGEKFSTRRYDELAAN
ncbi:MAG: transglycosylase SLT domain-containing protein [Gammaproteobacteria bacterium]|nr:transglycosylase SLT domain-containing protein [Gammaproteobacteria bacterium]